MNRPFECSCGCSWESEYPHEPIGWNGNAIVRGRVNRGPAVRRLTVMEMSELAGAAASTVRNAIKRGALVVGSDGRATQEEARRWAAARKRKQRHYKAYYRTVAARALGRKLKPTEVVHHTDGDRTNNRKDNLLVCEPPYHRYLHEASSWLQSNALLDYFSLGYGTGNLLVDEHYGCVK